LSVACASAQVNWFAKTNLMRYPAQMTIKVLDDDDHPIGGISVGASTFSKHIPGDNFGTDEHEIVTEVTDTNGVVTLAFSCITGEVAYSTRPFAGFYGNVGSQNFRFTGVTSGQWQPWNPTKEIHIKRILNPVPMYARRANEIKIPTKGELLGYDLMVGDWVAPYGKGETSDFILKYESKPEPKVPSRAYPPYDNALTVRFSNNGDGIQSFFAPQHSSSELRLPRQAPADGYESVLMKREYKEPGQSAYTDFREDQNYFFRVRTKKDAQGNIVRALYGKISGDFFVGGSDDNKLTFTYYLNPEPNSRNMEFDPKKNLSQNLKFMEGVRAP